MNYFITGAVAFAPRQARANREAAEADVVSSSEATRALVTNQYIASLKAQAQASLADSLVATATGQLDLANAKVKVGAGTIVDIRTAEVAVGQAQVNQVMAHNQAVIDKIRLFQYMGVPGDTSTKLTTQFAISQPNFTLDSVLSVARHVNPDVAADESRRFAAEMGVRTASTGYLPSLAIGTGWGGNSQIGTRTRTFSSLSVTIRSPQTPLRALALTPCARESACRASPAGKPIRCPQTKSRPFAPGTTSSRSSSSGIRSASARHSRCRSSTIIARSTAPAGARHRDNANVRR